MVGKSAVYLRYGILSVLIYEELIKMWLMFTYQEIPLLPFGIHFRTRKNQCAVSMRAFFLTTNAAEDTVSSVRFYESLKRQTIFLKTNA